MSGLYTRLVSGLLFPLHERLKQHDSVALRRGLEDSQWWPRERIEALQLERLRALLVHARDHVPYYREGFARSGFDPPAIASLAELQRLPFLGKAEIRANTEALKADDAVGLARFNTGGSSGEPLIFFIGDRRAAQTLRNMSEPVETLADDIEQLEDLKSIGKSIAEKIIAFLATGQIQTFEELKKKVPFPLLELMDIEGFGPATLRLLHDDLV